MSSLPQILVDFAKACQAHFGAGTAGCTDDGAFVAIGDIVVNVTLDAKAGRAVVWTELARPEHSDIAALERAAMAFTGRELVAHGLALGVNRAADLILLGRSVEQDALALDEGIDLVEAVAAAARPAAAALARAARPAGAHANGHTARPAAETVVFRS